MFLFLFKITNHPAISDSADKLTPAKPRDLAEAIAFALRFEARQREASQQKLVANSRLDAPRRHAFHSGTNGRLLGLCDPWRPDKRQSRMRSKGVAR